MKILEKDGIFLFYVIINVYEEISYTVFVIGFGGLCNI